MKSIIVPLNEFFFNWEKYDGTSPIENFWKRNPLIYKVLSQKYISVLIAATILSPFLLYYTIIYLWYKIRIGSEKAMEIMNPIMDKFIDSYPKFKFTQKHKNILPFLKKFQNNGYSLFIYYNDGMIPHGDNEKNEFYSKLENIKSQLNFKLVFNANTKFDIQDIIKTYNIDVNNSFFMTDGKIDLTYIPELKN